MNFVYFSKNSVKKIFRFIDLKLRQLHTLSQQHSHMHSGTQAWKVWGAGARTHIRHTCEDTQKSGIICDSQKNILASIWHLWLSALMTACYTNK